MTTKCNSTIFIVCILLKFTESLQTGHQAMPLLRNVVELMRQQQQISEKLNSKLRISICKVTVGAKHWIQLKVNCIPARSSLIEWMHQCKTVKWIWLEIFLAHFLVGLAGQCHVIPELPELLQHKILIGRLFKAHRPQNGFIGQSIGKPYKKICSLIMLTEQLEQFGHH